MTNVVQVVDAARIRQDEGIFLPAELFAGCKGVTVEMADDGAIILRPEKIERNDIYQRMDARREMLKAKYGVMEDSTPLIREDRDSR